MPRKKLLDDGFYERQIPFAGLQMLEAMTRPGQTELHVELCPGPGCLFEAFKVSVIGEINPAGVDMQYLGGSARVELEEVLATQNLILKEPIEGLLLIVFSAEVGF